MMAPLYRRFGTWLDQAALKEFEPALPDETGAARHRAACGSRSHHLFHTRLVDSECSPRLRRRLGGYRRAGDTEGGVTLVEGIDTIDASKVQTNFLGHSYFAESGSLLGDMRTIFIYRKHAEERTELTAVESPGGRYWVFSH